MATIGNHPALDLVNTRYRRGSETVDDLSTYRQLVNWLESAGRLSPATAARARSWARTAAADDALREAHAIRDAAHDVAVCLSHRASPSGATIAAINAHLQRPITTSTIVVRDGAPVRNRIEIVESPADLVIPLAEATRDLLLDADPALVRQCASSTCIRWFYDTSKRHARVWCSMDSCGNRAKATAHRERRRANTTPSR